MQSTRERNAQMAREYLAWCRDHKKLAGSTIHDYACSLDYLIEWVDDVSLDDVKLSDLEAFINRPRGGRAAGREGSPATRSKEVTVLRNLYRFLQARGRVRRNPCELLVAPSIPKRQPRPVPDSTWRQVWDSDRLSDLDRVVLGLGYFCGLRRREICQVGPHHFSPLTLRIVGFQRKGGGEDTLPYGSMVQVYEDYLPHLIGDSEGFLTPLHELVEVRREAKAQYLIPWAEASNEDATKWRSKHELPEGMTDPQKITREVGSMLKRCGLKRDAFTPHQLRHSCATNLLRAGMPIEMVSNLLAHTNIDTTRGYAKQGADELGVWLETQRKLRGERSVDPAEWNRHA